jgi:hypothetical protein
MDHTVRGGTLFGTIMAKRGGTSVSQGPSRLPGDDAWEQQQLSPMQASAEATKATSHIRNHRLGGITTDVPSCTTSSDSSRGTSNSSQRLPQPKARAAYLQRVHRNLGITKSSRPTSNSSQREQPSAYPMGVHLARVAPVASRPPGAVSPHNEPLLAPGADAVGSGSETEGPEQDARDEPPQKRARITLARPSRVDEQQPFASGPYV